MEPIYEKRMEKWDDHNIITLTLKITNQFNNIFNLFKSSKYINSHFNTHTVYTLNDVRNLRDEEQSKIIESAP